MTLTWIKEPRYFTSFPGKSNAPRRFFLTRLPFAHCTNAACSHKKTKGSHLFTKELNGLNGLSHLWLSVTVSSVLRIYIHIGGQLTSYKVN